MLSFGRNNLTDFLGRSAFSHTRIGQIQEAAPALHRKVRLQRSLDIDFCPDISESLIVPYDVTKY